MVATVTLHLEIDSERRIRKKLYDKKDDFNFLIVNFPFICSNIPAAPAYGVYISQLIRYSRTCEKGQGDVYDKWNISVIIFVRQIFHNGQPGHDGDCKTFEVMAST
jgi:hypothetical protein